MNRRDILAAIVAFAGACGLHQSPGLAQQPVRLATEASYPPFSQTEPDGSFSGFEIDLGNEVCRRVALTCTWSKQDFDGMIAALRAGKFDMIFSSMSIKPERQKVADFSIPYYADHYRFYGERDALPEVPGGLQGKKVGVYAGATEEQFVRARFSGVLEVRGYENIDQIHADLVAGRIDLAFNAVVPATAFLREPQGAAYTFTGPAYDDPAIFGPGVGAMFRKGDPLRSKVDGALRSIYADGTFDRLSAKYFAGANLHADGAWK